MASPYIVIVALVLWAASIAGVYEKATHDQEARDTAAATKALDEKLKSAEADWATNYQAALELEQEKQANELKHLSHSRAVAVAVAKDPHATDCALNADSLGVLVSSVRAANGSEGAAAGSGNGGLQPGNGTAGRNASGLVVRPGQHGLDAIDVSAGVQGTSSVGQ
jgi:hypothetical protein